MNYIQQLNAQIEALKTQRDAAREQLQELKGYLTSSKFAHGSELDGYVSTKDVLARLAQVDLGSVVAGGKTI